MALPSGHLRLGVVDPGASKAATAVAMVAGATAAILPPQSPALRGAAAAVRSQHVQKEPSQVSS